MMQCNPLLCGNRYPNLGQPYCYNNHQFQPQPVFPEIIGEGEVASVVFPDGSIHLYFIPLNKRFPPTCQHNSSYNPYFNNSMGAYYVRNISNPISSAVFNQQCQQMYGGRIPRPSYISDCNVNIPSPGFQLQFHNDCWTSTTDLHYFVPRLRRCELFPATEHKGCAATQVDIPVKEITFRNQEVTCARPCIRSISDDESWSGNETVECFCDKVEDSRRSRSCVANKHPGSKKRVTLQKNKQKLKPKKSVESECNEPNTTDKCITTYAEQASSCAAENERNTQTCRSCTTATSVRSANSVVNRSEGKTELWLPKLLQGKEPISMARSSEKIIGVYEVTTCSSETCCCSTDTETRDA